MKSRKLYIVVAALLFAATLPSRSFAQSQTSNDEAQQLRKLVEQMRLEMQTQMSKMQEEIDQLKGTKPEMPPSQPTVAPAGPPPQQEATTQAAKSPLEGTTSKQVGKDTATYQQFSEDTVAAPRYDNVPLDPKYQGFFRLPGTQDILKIGGYFKTDFIYDFKPAGNTDTFIPSSFPVPQASSVNNANVSIRATRLNLDFRIPSSKVGEVRFYIEGDFFGTNATTPRLRHAYAQVGNFLIGQTFTNFMDPDAMADTLDFQGPNGLVYVRNPQFRYGFALSPSTTFYVSVEKPSSDVLFKTELFSDQPNAPAPDAAIRLRQEYQRGHFQVAAIFRDIAAYLPNGTTGSVFGWGVNTSLKFNTFGKDNIVLAVAAGHGISRYIQDTSGLGIDAEPTLTPTPHLQATPAAGVEAAYQHYWLGRLRSSLVYSYAAVNNTDFAVPTTYNHATYTTTNLIWNPIGSFNVGGEFLYGWVMDQNHKSANDPRIQFSVKYDFVKVNPD